MFRWVGAHARLVALRLVQVLAQRVDLHAQRLALPQRALQAVSARFLRAREPDV